MILYPANSEDDFVILNGIGYARAHHYDHVQIMETCDFASIPADEPVAIIGHGEPPEVIEEDTVLEPTLAEKMPWEVGSMLDNGKYQKKAPILLISCSAGVSSKQESKDSFVHLLAAEFPGVAVTGKRGIALFGKAIPDTVIDPLKSKEFTAAEITIRDTLGFNRPASQIDWGNPFPVQAGIEDRADFVYNHPKLANLYKKLREMAENNGYILPPPADELTYIANE